ncbi:pseudouridine synthase, partial [Pavlovales sp. CCMP2436]
MTDREDLASAAAPTGSYMRVHVYPRRYPATYQVDWQSCVLSVSAAFDRQFVGLDKPAGVPMSACIDNRVECCKHQLEHALDLPLDLHVAGRLDACTTGCVVLARSPAAALAINAALAAREIKKRYRVLSTGHVPVGPVRHASRRKSKRHPDAKPTLLRAYDERLVTGAAQSEWQLAELVVLSCVPVEPHVARRLGHLADAPGEPPPSLFESEVELVTGRTHQIRLQFSALNAPIFEDTRYAPAAGKLDQSDDEELDEKLAGPRELRWGDGSALFGQEPKRIGLQCAELRFPYSALGLDTADPEQAAGSEGDLAPMILLAAGTPWWR